METRAGHRFAAVVSLALFAGAPVLAGEIAGVLAPAERVKSVRVVDREAKKTYPATLDAKTGQYRARNLPAGTYDLVLETTAGRIEGVNLKVPASEVTAEPMTLKSSDMDKDEIARIAAFLAKAAAERGGRKVEPSGFIVRIRDGKLAGAALAAGGKTIEVPLKDDEPEELAEEVLVLARRAREAARRGQDLLPRDYDLAAELAGGLKLTPVAPDLTDKDRAWIVDWVDKLKLFENKKRVLDMDGTGEHARVLVEKLRDDDAGPTTLAVKEPTAFWRIEIFDFNKHYGGWTKDKATVVVREQATIREFRAYCWMFEKRLGGIAVPADGTTTVPPYEVPEKLDPAKGRTP